jgi:hypothetical protein
MTFSQNVMRKTSDINRFLVVRLQTITASCDASILENLMLELMKLTGHLVKKWGLTHTT